MAENFNNEGGAGLTRRRALECMAWAGGGLIWTMAGGVPVAEARRLGGGGKIAKSGLSFLQISDTHVGFSGPANPTADESLLKLVGHIRALPEKPAFMLHTGDITHLAKAEQFDMAAQVIGSAGVDVHFVPGEHDVGDETGGGLYRAHYGGGAKGDGWRSFDYGGVHFVALVNVLNFAATGLGSLGETQLAWLKDDLSAVSSSTPVVVFAHVPLWSAYPDWGWATGDGPAAIRLLRRFGSVTVLNGHIHQTLQKVEGDITFWTANSTAFPQAAPGASRGPGPLKVAPGELVKLLGIRTVTVTRNGAAITETTLENA